MQINCTKEELARALSIVRVSVSSRSTLPVLSCILLRACDGLYLSATNLSTFVTTLVDTETATFTPHVSIAIPYRRLSDVVANASDNITMIPKGDSVEVKWGRSKVSIKTMLADDFPVIPEFFGGVMVDAEEFGKAIDRVSFSAYEDEQTVLGGILASLNNGKLSLVATDRNRLSVSTCSTEDERGGVAIIPASRMNEIRRLITGRECLISFGESRLGFQSGDTTFFSQVLAGTFPDYNQVIPFDHTLPITAEFFSSEFLGIVKAARVVSMDYNDYLEMEVGNGKIAISCKTVEGDFDAEFDAETVGELHFGVSAKFLYDWLNNVGAARGKLMLRDEGSFAKLVPVGQDSIHCFGLMHLRR